MHTNHHLAPLYTLYTRLNESKPTAATPECPRRRIVVVGGGIVGTSLAYHLTQHVTRPKVTLIERSFVGSGASGLSAGTMDSPLRPSQCALTCDGSSQQPLVPLDAFEAHLVAGSIRCVETLESLGYDCEHVACGSLTLLDSAEHLAERDYRAYYEQHVQHAHEMGATDVSWQERVLGDGESVPTLHAVRHPHSCQVNPLALTQHLATLAATRGATVHEHTQLTRCTRDTDTNTYTLYDNRGRKHVADTVVLATGVYQDNVERVFGVRAPVEAVKGTMWAYDDPPPDAPATSKETHNHNTPLSLLRPPPILYSTRSLWRWVRQPPTQLPLTTAPHDVHFYSKTDANGILHFGAQRTLTTEHDPCNTRANDFARVRYTVEQLLPALRARPLWGWWSGLMPFGAENQVVLRELSAEELPNVWLVNGFGAHGIMLAPMAMAFIAQVLVVLPFTPTQQGV